MFLVVGFRDVECEDGWFIVECVKFCVECS